MQGEQGRSRAGARRAITLGSIAVLMLGGAADAYAAKKKRATPPARTVAVPGPLVSGGSAFGTAGCKGDTHATGGGFAVSPVFSPNPTPPSGTGLRSMTVGSVPVGDKGWKAGAFAFRDPAGSGTLTTFVRCEANRLGRIILRGSNSVTLAPGAAQSFVFNCPGGTHVISGGYSGDGPGALEYPPNNYRIVFLGSLRTGARQWTITAYNRADAPGDPPNASANLAGWAVCEQNRKKMNVTETSTVTGVAENARAAAVATCGGKKHAVSGGFSVGPASFPGTVPVVAVDENHPLGKKGWRVGLHEWQGNSLPGPTSLTTYAYCKRDKLPSPKRK